MTNNIQEWNLDSISPSQAILNPTTIKYIHVYDFDNTIFYTPEPNRRIWTPSTFNFLQSSKNFFHGSWWTYPKILESTGKGIDIEEPRAWNGWWNEEVVQLVQESMADPYALCVLLTGRQKDRFGSLITRIVQSRNLTFDIMALKSGDFKDTLEFKSTFIKNLIDNYTNCKCFTIYEDRPHHVHYFRNLLQKIITEKKLSLYPSVIEVISQRVCK